MKKLLMLLLPILFVYACKDSEFEDSLYPDQDVVTFKDIVLENNQPVPGAVVSIYANGKRYVDITDAHGEYDLVVPADSLLVDGFMSLSIALGTYKPLNVTYQAPLTANAVYDSKNVAKGMTKCAGCLNVANENFSELYHLGDDSFSGSINSQFQKVSDGIEVSFNFTNSTSSKLKFNFEAKGIQTNIDPSVTPTRIVFAGVEYPLDMSPDDGSYAAYSVVVNNDPAVDTVFFRTSSPRPIDGDVDDWEFTSFYIEGLD